MGIFRPAPFLLGLVILIGGVFKGDASATIFGFVLVSVVVLVARGGKHARF